MSWTAYTEADDRRLAELLARHFNVDKVSLSRLPQPCISRIYRAEVPSHGDVFVKWGQVLDSSAVDFITQNSTSGLVPRLITDMPLVLDEKPVLCFDWMAMEHLRIDQMTDAKFVDFLDAYWRLHGLMQEVGSVADPDDSEQWFNVVRDYARNHPLARLFLGPLLEIELSQCKHDHSEGLSVTHGDFHSRNFGLHDEGGFRFVDFDNFIMAYKIEDMAFAFAEAARRCGFFCFRRRLKLYGRVKCVARNVSCPASHWRVAFNRIRLMQAAKSISRHPDRFRIVFNISHRDSRMARLAKAVSR